MPTIFRQNGFRFVIWPDDHLPPHVHVFKAGHEIKINLGIAGELPWVRVNYGMSRQQENAVLLIVALNNRDFLKHWENINGKIIDNSST